MTAYCDFWQGGTELPTRKRKVLVVFFAKITKIDMWSIFGCAKYFYVTSILQHFKTRGLNECFDLSQVPFK